MLTWPDGEGPDLLVDDGGDATLLIHGEGCSWLALVCGDVMMCEKEFVLWGGAAHCGVFILVCTTSWQCLPTATRVADSQRRSITLPLLLFHALCHVCVVCRGCEG